MNKNGALGQNMQELPAPSECKRGGSRGAGYSHLHAVTLAKEIPGKEVRHEAGQECA